MPATRPRLLLIDDESASRDVLSRYLDAKGFDVVGLGDAESALELLRAERFDAILLDNSLPGMMGIVALPKLVALTKAPILMMTGYPAEETYKDAQILGAAALLPKPLDLDAAVAALRKLIAAAQSGAS